VVHRISFLQNATKCIFLPSAFGIDPQPGRYRPPTMMLPRGIVILDRTFLTEKNIQFLASISHSAEAKSSAFTLPLALLSTLLNRECIHWR
jgi:hypothetical protein